MAAQVTAPAGALHDVFLACTLLFTSAGDHAQVHCESRAGEVKVMRVRAADGGIDMQILIDERDVERFFDAARQLRRDLRLKPPPP